MTVQNSIILASDHAGLALKATLTKALEKEGIAVHDLGTYSESSVDYPDFAKQLADSIRTGVSDRGILICGSGIGMSMAANRYPYIRAALCHNVETASLARQHNNANVLVLGARIISEATALACMEAFLHTNFEGGRHQARIDKFS